MKRRCSGLTLLKDFNWERKRPSLDGPSELGGKLVTTLEVLWKAVGKSRPVARTDQKGWPAVRKQATLTDRTYTNVKDDLRSLRNSSDSYPGRYLQKVRFQKVLHIL